MFNCPSDLLDVVDHQMLDRSLALLQFQAELLNRRKNRNAVGIYRRSILRRPESARNGSICCAQEHPVRLRNIP